MRSFPSIPGYELLHCLGGGPMTMVYAGRDLQTDTPCAIKLLRAGWEEEATAIKLLQREARAGLSVRHAHLVRILYAHVTRAPYFLVMDWLPGESVRSKLRRHYRLEMNEALWITRQAAEALAALHQEGFLHGDVKPGNLRLIGDGQAVLIDLGFAHRPGENDRLLQQGYVLGTANYLAPELCDPEPGEDLASDMFSLGVTLFEMLTGRLPYPPGSLQQTFRRHHCDPPADIRRNVASVPSGLVTLVGKLLARKAEDRPRAAAVVRQLIMLEIAALQVRSSTRGERRNRSA